MSIRFFALSAAGVALLGGLGCSDPVPLPAQGAFSMNVRAPTGPNAGGCKVQAHTANIGTPPLTSTNSDVDRAVDKQGKPSADVSCTVKGKSTFSVKGNVKKGVTSFNVTLIEDIGKGGSARATVSEFDATSAVTLSSPAETPCTVSLAGGNLEIAPGRIWATFDCPVILDPRSPGTTTCTADGVFLFENCEQ